MDEFVKVHDLVPVTSNHNLVLKVVECKVVVDRTRQDGTRVRMAEAVVGDETGVITLTAHNDQISVVSQPGATIVVRNGKIDMFQGCMRLSVDKWGAIGPAQSPAVFTPNTTNDMSLVEYELVTIDNDDDPAAGQSSKKH